jgi:hypothetical protein
MIKNEYNGWTNKQTWNINLTYQEIFTSMVEDQTFDDVDHLADAFESLVDELEFQVLKDGSLAHQAVGEYLDRVNWMEIAEHYAADFELFKEEEEHDYVSEMRCRLN